MTPAWPVIASWIALGLSTLPLAQEAPSEALPPLSGASAASPDARELALAARDGSVLILDLAKRRVRARIHAAQKEPGPAPELTDLTWSPDGRRLATLDAGGRVQVLDSSTGVVEAGFTTSEQGTSDAPWMSRMIRFAAGGDVLLVACGAAVGELRTAESGELVRHVAPGKRGSATACATSRDGELAALGDQDGNVAVWNARSGELAHGPMAVGRFVNALELDPTGSLLAIGSRDCEVRLWKLSTTDEVRKLSHCDQDVFGDLSIGWIRFSPDGKRFLSTSTPFWEARVWDLATGKELWRHDYGGGNAALLSAAFSGNGSFVVLGLHGLVLDATNGSVHRALGSDPKGTSGSQGASRFRTQGGIAWSLDSDRLLVVALDDGRTILDWSGRAEEDK
jgi:WD40 repeat protein